MPSSTESPARNQFERDEVVQIINSVLNKVSSKDDPLPITQIAGELHQLYQIIQNVRSDISGIALQDIKANMVPTATDELDAVVLSMEEATGQIMDSCDVIQTLLSDGKTDAIADHVMKIFEACSFQDLSGQRIAKVVKSLKLIEEKVSKLMGILGPQITGKSGTGPASSGGDGLLNGPALPKDRVSQDDIDALLASFD